MLDVTVRLLAAFAAHEEHGINEMSQSLPRQNLGTKPDDEAPPIVPIFNDVDDSSVAKDLTAPETPAVIFWGDSAADIKLQGYKVAKEVAIACAFITDASSDDLVMNVACGYILRGATLTFERYNNQENSKGYRDLNGIRVLKISSITEQRVTAPMGRQKMQGFLVLRAVVVETYS